MKRDVAEELLSAYLDGELDASEEATLQRALAVDSQLQLAYEEMQALSGALQALPGHRLETEFSSDVMREFQRRQMVAKTSPPESAVNATPSISIQPEAVTLAADRQRYIRRQRLVWGAAFTAVTAAAASVILVLRLPSATEVGVAEAPPAAPATAAGDDSRPSAPLANEDASPSVDPPAVAESTDKTDETPPPPEAIVGADPPQISPPDASPAARPPADSVATDRGMPNDPPNPNLGPQPRLDRQARVGPQFNVPPKLPRSPFQRPIALAGEIIVLLDANRDGIVTDDEAFRAARILLPRMANSRRPTESGKLILQMLDLDKDGTLQPNESRWGVANARLQLRGHGAMVGTLLGVVDDDADGLVTVLEFQTLLDQLQEIGDLAESYLAAWFNILDADDDSVITVIESQMMADAFVVKSGVEIQPISAVGPAAPSPALLPLVWQKIVRLDRNRDGQISQREVRQDDQLRNAFGLIDQSGDGFLTAGELFDYLQSRNPSTPDVGLRIRFRVKTRG